jgi:hypothetical protein
MSTYKKKSAEILSNFCPEKLTSAWTQDITRGEVSKGRQLQARRSLHAHVTGAHLGNEWMDGWMDGGIMGLLAMINGTSWDIR